jgi:GntR family transcriptional regulator, galactonate operon transcriptional repressor
MTAAIRVRGRLLVDRVVQVIGIDIATGHFPPGAQLPNEAEWCERLDVSRSVLREALRVLVSKNLIDIRARSGGRVRDQAVWNLLDPDILIWRAQGQDQDAYVTELFELRRMLEPAAAGLAATRISPAQLVELKRAYEEMSDAGEDPARFFGPDARFHRTILGAVGNPLFRALGETVAVALDITLRLSLDAPKGQQQSLPFHKTVLEAIGSGDHQAAAAAMLALVDAAERDVAEAREEKNPSRNPRKRASGGRKP